MELARGKEDVVENGTGNMMWDQNIYGFIVDGKGLQ